MLALTGDLVANTRSVLDKIDFRFDIWRAQQRYGRSA
jgi:hypothetical protein